MGDATAPPPLYRKGVKSKGTGSEVLVYDMAMARAYPEA